MPKQYNCENCGFFTKYKNRIDYHINKRRSCGIEHINFKRLKQNDDLPSDEKDETHELLDDNKIKESELEELKLLLEIKEQTLNERENELIQKENTLERCIQKLANERKTLTHKPVSSQTKQTPKIIFQ
jgi:hypothetical protein